MQNGRGKGQRGACVLLGEMPRSAWEKLIDEWIFSERDRAILKRRLLDGITFERLSEEFDLSVRQIKNITAAATAELSRHL